MRQSLPGLYAKWSRSLENICHNIGDLGHFWLLQPTLGSPGCTQAETGGIEGCFITGDCIAIDYESGDIQNTGGHISRKWCTVWPDDCFTVKVSHVGVGTAVRNPHAAFNESVNECTAIFENLGLELAESFGLGQFESQC